MSTKSAVILANFGGPRTLEEVSPFLVELLTDEEVIRTSLPRFFETWLFKKIAVRRAKKVSHDYAKIGGKSPLFEDTEAVAEALRKKIDSPVLTFHRYLPATHAPFLELLRGVGASSWIVLPMYPQFSYSTTGSVARFFSKCLPNSFTHNMRWIASYAAHPCYVQAMQNCIQEFLTSHHLAEEDVVLFFSAHGLPQAFVRQGDPYEKECQQSYHAIRAGFPKAVSVLAFQSKFGPGEWLRPYTSELSEEPHLWAQGRKHVVFVPLSFTSDHLETLFEIEDIYLTNIRKKGLNAYRCPALNRRPDWIDALATLVRTPSLATNDALIRKKSK